MNEDYHFFNTQIAFLLIFIASYLVPQKAHAQTVSENLFYMVDSETSFQSFKNNIDQISIIGPQVFSINEHGVVWGEVDARVLKLAKKHEVKVMPLVMNPGFDRELFHKVLTNEEAQDRIINYLIHLAQKYDFYGWQFDFENVNVTDRDRLTAFYQKTARTLHDEGLKISIAVVPRDSDYDIPTSYHYFIFKDWRSPYDYKALAEAGDFLSYMTYSQHTRRTTPGPVAGMPWMTHMIKFILDQGVDPQKISIGIPIYSYHWYSQYTEGQGASATASGLSYQSTAGLIDRYDAKKVWLDDQKCYYAMWDHDGLFEYAFLEDQLSFKARLELLDQYDFRGISVWRLGQEDPGIWDVLQKQVQTAH